MFADFGTVIIPAVLNLNDPDTIHYPIFVEFDAVFLWSLYLSEGSDSCPPTPLTVLAYFETLIKTDF
jgi:hypothetical protein